MPKLNYENVRELWASTSWRATRYAMEGDRVAHDVVMEVLYDIQFFLKGDDSPIPCTCKFPGGPDA